MALGGVYLGQFAVVALGVLAIGSEFASGMLRTTFAATPRRQDVLAARAARRTPDRHAALEREGRAH